MNKITIGVSLLIVVAVIFFLRGGPSGNVTGNAVLSGVDAQIIDAGDSYKIALNEIGKDAQWFTHNSNGVNVKYFVVRDKDGNVKTAYDACDVCYRSKKGYRQEGEDMICNNCGNHYPVSGIGTQNLKGGCWPSYLKNSNDGEYLVITKAALDAGKSRF